MTRIFIVDFQGFKINKNKFVFKEVAVWDCTVLWAPRGDSLVFSLPFPHCLQTDEDKMQTQWIENNLGLRWREKGIPYRFLSMIINAHFSKADIVFVKGCEKKEWLHDYLPLTCKLIDLYGLGCPSFKTLLTEHSAKTMKVCLRHECMLFDWLCQNACWEVSNICK